MLSSSPGYNTVVEIYNHLGTPLTDGDWDVSPVQSSSLNKPTTVKANGRSTPVTIEAQTGLLYPLQYCVLMLFNTDIYSPAAIGSTGMITFQTNLGGNTVYLWMWFSSNNNHKVVQAWGSQDSLEVTAEMKSRSPLTGKLHTISYWMRVLTSLVVTYSCAATSFW